jgi:pimeloyl-ACP methyl ester carboxylesterase
MAAMPFHKVIVNVQSENGRARRQMTRTIMLCLLTSLLWGQAATQTAVPKRVHVNGVDLHYIEQGEGEPVILLHGGQGDYRSWAAQVEALAPHYRVISYSRRYHYPNDNPWTAKYRTAYTEAEDLAAFMRDLRLGRVHLVGTSAGALTALVLATQHPGMVGSMVLAEPPILSWAREDAQGESLYKEFMAATWKPATAAFKAGDDQGAMRILVDTFGGAGRFDRLPPEGRTVAMQNSRFFKASTASSDPFPALSKEKVKRLNMPILIIRGEHTLKINKFVNAELARLLPKSEQAIIPEAGHGSARDNPQAFNEVVADFLRKHSQ